MSQGYLWLCTEAQVLCNHKVLWDFCPKTTVRELCFAWGKDDVCAERHERHCCETNYLRLPS